MYPDYVVGLAREYRNVIHEMRSGKYDGDGVSELEREREQLHTQLEAYLAEFWKKKSKVSIKDMYDFSTQIIMGSNLNGR